MHATDYGTNDVYCATATWYKKTLLLTTFTPGSVDLLHVFKLDPPGAPWVLL